MSATWRGDKRPRRLPRFTGFDFQPCSDEVPGECGRMDYQYRFTVFTPTYNRASLLPRVYESLKRQSYRDFEWLIVDDGSTDATRELVESWLAGSPFPIRY